MRSKRGVWLWVVVLGTVWAGAQTGAGEKPITGFTPERSAAQRQLEEKFLALPDNLRAEQTHAKITAEPHVSGSAADRRVVEYLAEEYRQAGFETEIEEFQVLLPEPKVIQLDLVEPEQFSGPRPESVPEDPASKDPRTLPGFNGYSGSGHVTAEVVYAHYGLPADYDRLRAEGVSVKGKIVIARYGQSFRGVKAKVAEENQAAALVIYSDPNDDGYHAGDAYPNGPWRPASAVQRGSVLYIFEYPGDPTTPDGPSVEGADRISAFEAKNMPRIPVLPISYADARVFLEHLGGPAAPREWQGGLPFTYHLGPGPARARLRVEVDHVVKPIWNVAAKIRGAERPDEIVLLGNHHDAWTYGGVDPNSGTTSMLEIARSLGELMKEGWRPRRSIWMLEWDGEEQGLLGSTEWAEKHADTIREKVVAYLNLDSSVSGTDFDANAVPSLKPFVREVAAATPDPRGGTVLEQAERHQREEARREVVPGRVPRPQADPKPVGERPFRIENLGSGSDYTAFLDHLGIPATDIGFSGRYGVYHSIFDNHRWMKEWGDPEFRYHVAAAQLLGLKALRLAEADLLPFDYEAYGEELGRYLDGIERKLTLLDRAEALDFTAPRAAAERLAEAGRAVREKYQWAVAQGLRPEKLDGVNRALVDTEKAFLLPEGLPKRPWFKHAIFAPGTYTGYAAVPLPGVHESIDAGEFEEAGRQVAALTAALNRAAAGLEALQ